MKAHSAAKVLESIASMLRESDDVEIASSKIQLSAESNDATPMGTNAPAALALLVRLAAYSKPEWRALIDHLELQVEIKATDSVRDILGRLLKYLNDNKDVHERLVEKAKKPQANVSPELMKALSILMNK